MGSNIPEIGKEFIEYINDNTKKVKSDVLLYGSTVYGNITSDLDITFFVKDIKQEDYKTIERLTIEFQKEHNMSLDDEVPYASKLIYTEQEIEYMLRNSPFKKVNGIYVISPIEKTKEFLGSKEMKYRLLLNILTTRFSLLQGDVKKINKYKQKAWELLISVIVSYNRLSEIDLDHFIKMLQKDEKTNNSGEMFLGYKTNIKQKQYDLEDDCERTLYRLAKEEKIKQKSSRIFSIPDDDFQR